MIDIDFIKGQEIVVGNTKYIYDIDEHGRSLLKTYDSDYKMWGTLVFSDFDTDAEERLIEALSNEYFKKFH